MEHDDEDVFFVRCYSIRSNGELPWRLTFYERNNGLRVRRLSCVILKMGDSYSRNSTTGNGEFRVWSGIHIGSFWWDSQIELLIIIKIYSKVYWFCRKYQHRKFVLYRLAWKSEFLIKARRAKLQIPFDSAWWDQLLDNHWTELSKIHSNFLTTTGLNWVRQRCYGSIKIFF